MRCWTISAHRPSYLTIVAAEAHADLPTGTPEGVSVAFEFVHADEPGPILVNGHPVVARKGTGAYGPEHAHLYRR